MTRKTVLPRRRRWWLPGLVTLLVVLIAGCSSGSAPPPGPPSSLGFGIAGDFIGRTPAEVNKALTDYQSVGMKWARVQVLWYHVQTSEGGKYEWSEYDALMASLKAHNIRPIALLSSTPSWARSDNCTSTGGWEYACPPADVAGFAAFSAAAAVRYAKYGVVWEVWNEPNLKAFWQPAPDAAQYTNLLSTTYTAIKKAEPKATVISAGLAPALNPSESVDPVQFLNQIYDNGGGGHFDGVGWHPYLAHELGQPPPLPGDSVDPSGWSQMYATSASARSIMADHGDSGKKIWVTEFGNHTSADSLLAADDAAQAAIMARAVKLWSTFDWAGAFCFYTYQDSQPYGATDNGEAYFGLWRSDHLPKPAVAALRSAIAAVTAK